MNRFPAKTLLLVIFTLSCVLSTQAWDETGHKLTGYIAWSRMTPDVRARVIRLGRGYGGHADTGDSFADQVLEIREVFVT